MSTTDIRTHLEMLIAEFFRAVSFQTGESPAYAKIHALFVQDGKLIKNSSDVAEVSTIEQFIASRQQTIDPGTLTSFQENEAAEITEIFGNVADRFSTYTKRGTVDGVAVEGRGLISTQLIRTPNGWKITSMAWDDERPGLTIPDLPVEPRSSS
jgi:hypothetical protein